MHICIIFKNIFLKSSSVVSLCEALCKSTCVYAHMSQCQRTARVMASGSVPSNLSPN